VSDSDTGGTDHQPPADVDGGADHCVAGADLDRHGLAGEHRGVDGGGAFGDDSIGGDLLAGADAEDVSDDELVGRDPDLDTVAHDGDVLGAHVQQGAQRSAGSLLGLGLEVASGQDEHGDHGGGFEVDVRRTVSTRGQEVEAHPHAGHAGATKEQRPQGPEPCSAHTNRDQGVHGRCPVAGIGECGPVERQRTPHHDGGGQGQGKPLPVVELQRRDHRQQEHRQAQDRRDQQPLSQ